MLHERMLLNNLSSKGFVYSSSVNNGYEITNELSELEKKETNFALLCFFYRLYITYRIVVKGTYQNAREG